MHPSPEAVAYIKAHADLADPDDAAVAAGLNAATAPNPAAAAPKVRSTCYPSDILPMLDVASLEKINVSAFAGRLYDDMNSNNAPGVARWAQFFDGIGAISPEEAGAIIARATATHDDPAWTATLPAPLATLGRLLDADDVAAARAAGGH